VRPALPIAAAVVALAGAACQGEREGAAEREAFPRQPCRPAGTWACSRDADWVREVLRVAGYAERGSTGSAVVARSRRAGFFIWTTQAEQPLRETARPAPLFGRLAGVPIYGDGVRVVWRAQGRNVWLEAGPRGDAKLPARGRLAALVVTTRRLPRERRPVELTATPGAALRRCRSSALVRPACPLRTPAVPAERLEAHVSRGLPGRGAHAFGLQAGAEYPGRPELNRPPNLLHLVLLAGSLGSKPLYELSEEVRLRDGLLREVRERGLLFGRVRWGGRSGTLVLAPPFPAGGVEGNHLVFRWSRGRDEYALSLHAWEPLQETAATLRAVAQSVPP
jgi:hypothetical protein